MWKAVSSLSLLTLLFSLSDFWRETLGGHGLDHAHFCRPVYIWRSQWVPLHLLPVSAIQALPGPGTPLLCILLCICGGGLSPSTGLCVGAWWRSLCCSCGDARRVWLYMWWQEAPAFPPHVQRSRGLRRPEPCAWQQDSILPAASESLFHLPRNRPCWLERNPTLKETRRDPCPGPLG